VTFLAGPGDNIDPFRCYVACSVFFSIEPADFRLKIS
jgi:hypothetical protein